MLAKPRLLFEQALAGGYAIGAFNVSNLELVQAVVGAAEAQKSPVIVQTSESAIEYAGIKNIVDVTKNLADAVGVPVVLHLDHGKSLEIAQDCIAAGYSSVMIDASKLPYQENMGLVKQVADLAHDKGIWVEAELGAILGVEGMKDLGVEGTTPEDMFTKPEQAAEFIEKTGCDALAVSVGTIHGAFTGQEYIRFELLNEVQKAVPDFPLVLHGASGISSDHLARATKENVCKVNVDTEMRIAFTDAVKAYFDEEYDKLDPRKILGPAREAVQAVIEEKMEVFGSSGKA